jgi:CBS domain containing-hemolysin-like protein
MEIAFVSVSRLRLEILNQQGSLGGKILSNHMKKPARFISATLIGNNITLVIYGILMTQMLDLQLPISITSNAATSLIVQTLISTVIVLFIGEFIPKVLFQLKSVQILSFFAPVFQIIYFCLFPFVSFFMFLSAKILKLFKQNQPVEETIIFGSKDFNEYLKETDEESFKEEFNVDPKLLENVLEFKDVKIRACMVPRTEIIAFDIEDSIEDLRKVFIETRHSRILIYQETIDNIIGYVHHFALLEPEQDLKKMLIPILLITESMNANDLLDAFIEKNKGIAWVVDEFGGTAGMITLEDLLEEIIGEIEDEYDDENLLDKKISEEEYLFSARLEIDFLNDKYELGLPEGDYETIAGLVISEAENIPRKGQKVFVEQFEFTVLDSTKTKINKVKLMIKRSNIKADPFTGK